MQGLEGRGLGEGIGRVDTGAVEMGGGFGEDGMETLSRKNSSPSDDLESPRTSRTRQRMREGEANGGETSSQRRVMDLPQLEVPDRTSATAVPLTHNKLEQVDESAKFGDREGEEDGDVTTKGCRCGISKCLKQYCCCFRTDVRCNEECKCTDCHNDDKHEKQRVHAIRRIRRNYPSAFKGTALEVTETEVRTPEGTIKQTRGCRCKRSQCQQNYCECFGAGLACTANCVCTDCENGNERSPRAEDLILKPDYTKLQPALTSARTVLLANSRAKRRRDPSDSLTSAPNHRRRTSSIKRPRGSVSKRFTEELKEHAGDLFHHIVKHPFTDALAAGTIDQEAMKLYLNQDHRFLDNFVVLLARMVSEAPTLADRIPGCQFLGLVTGVENSYFERSLTALGVSEEQRKAAPTEKQTQQFLDLMRDAAASGKIHEMLAVLVVAEWSYLSWANRVKHLRAPTKPFWCNEWIDLHCGDYFESVIEYLRSLLDRISAKLTDAEKEECKATFKKACQFEVDFFDMAWAIHTARAV